MIIQCPECKARYRAKALPEGVTTLQVKCPKCQHTFQIDRHVSPPVAASQELPTILMVDDARFFRELMQDLLKERQAKLLTADSAADAERMLRQHQVQLLIVDINLPDKNGLELVRELRADDRFAALKILCISGVYRKDDDARKAVQAGADDFISKSFNPDELNERIDRLLK